MTLSQKYTCTWTFGNIALFYGIWLFVTITSLRYSTVYDYWLQLHHCTILRYMIIGYSCIIALFYGTWLLVTIASLHYSKVYDYWLQLHHCTILRYIIIGYNCIIALFYGIWLLVTIASFHYLLYYCIKRYWQRLHKSDFQRGRKRKNQQRK